MVGFCFVFLALLQVTEKTDAYLDNLRVGLELWEKQLMLGGEVDNWAGAKLALFAESHPFHTEQQVLHMRVRPLCKAKCATAILIPWSRYRFQNYPFFFFHFTGDSKTRFPPCQVCCIPVFCNYILGTNVAFSVF